MRRVRQGSSTRTAVSRCWIRQPQDRDTPRGTGPGRSHRRQELPNRRRVLSEAMSSVPLSSSAHPAVWKFGYPIYHAESRAQWRAWLEAHHHAAPGVWLCSWRAATARPTCPYPDVVEVTPPCRHRVAFLSPSAAGPRHGIRRTAVSYVVPKVKSRRRRCGPLGSDCRSRWPGADGVPPPRSRVR